MTITGNMSPKVRQQLAGMSDQAVPKEGRDKQANSCFISGKVSSVSLLNVEGSERAIAIDDSNGYFRGVYPYSKVDEDAATSLILCFR